MKYDITRFKSVKVALKELELPRQRRETARRSPRFWHVCTSDKWAHRRLGLVEEVSGSGQAHPQPGVWLASDIAQLSRVS